MSCIYALVVLVAVDSTSQELVEFLLARISVTGQA